MKIKIKDYIKNALGLTTLEKKVKFLENQNEAIKDRLDFVLRMNETIMGDNKLVLRHVQFLNSQFSVVSEINNSKYEPSVVIIFHRGGKEIVKSYVFDNCTVEHIYQILEGFGQDNNRIDKPRGMPGPRWRY